MSTARSLSRHAKRQLLDSLSSATHAGTYELEHDETVLDVKGIDSELELSSNSQSEMRHECSCTENEYSLSDEEEETWKVGGNSQSKDFAPNKEEAECNAFSLTENLLFFYRLFNISRDAMQFLLDALNRQKVDAPKSIYHLTKNAISKRHSILTIGDCQTSYFGLKDTIEFCLTDKTNYLTRNKLNDGDRLDITVRINYDGIPIYKSTPYTLWPIFGDSPGHF